MTNEVTPSRTSRPWDVLEGVASVANIVKIYLRHVLPMSVKFASRTSRPWDVREVIVCVVI